MHSADYAVRQSVRLSVTRRYSVNTAEHVLHFLLSGSLTILVYPYQILLQSFNGDRPNGGVECKGYEKNHDFRQIYRFVSEIILKNNNNKWYKVGT